MFKTIVYLRKKKDVCEEEGEEFYSLTLKHDSQKEFQMRLLTRQQRTYDLNSNLGCCFFFLQKDEKESMFTLV